jgi:hypothetical protein
MPPNFICFFLSFFEHAPAKKNEGLFGFCSSKPRKLEKGAKQKEQKTRDRMAHKNRKKRGSWTLLSVLSSLSSFAKRKQEDG